MKLSREIPEITQESNRDKTETQVFYLLPQLHKSWSIPEFWWCRNQKVAFIVLNS